MKVPQARSNWSIVVGLVAVLVLSQACASARVSQFRTFASAGTAYSEAANRVTGEAGILIVDESSDTLVLTRDTVTQERREAEIKRRNESDREFLLILRDIRRHNLLLRDYFAALAALAESEAPAQIGKSASDLAGALGTLHPAIENASINGTPVKSLIQPAVQLAVAQFQQHQLEAELRARAPAIERELALQEAAMKAVADGMQGRLKALLASRESTAVVLPYVDVGSPGAPRHALPKRWKKDRREVLTASSSVESVTAASDAAEKLRNAFGRLVSGQLSVEEIQLVLQDVGRALELVELLAGKREAD